MVAALTLALLLATAGATTPPELAAFGDSLGGGRSSGSSRSWSGDEETVSSCTSQGTINSSAPTEIFAHADERGGYLSYLFFVFATEHFPDGGETVVTVHVDEEVGANSSSSSTVSFRLYEAIGIWPRDERTWGTSLFGKGGKNGAVYVTVKMPFERSVRVTAQIPPGLPPAGPPAGRFGHGGGSAGDGQDKEMIWACARAVLGSAVQASHAGVAIPRSARLKVQVVRGAVLRPFEQVTMLSSLPGKAACIVALTMLVDAPGLNSFEGCVRQYEGSGGNNGGNSGGAGESGTAVRVVAGGLEDVASSSFYFQQVGDARFTLPEVGVTHFEWNPHGRVAMYRLFSADSYFIPAAKNATWTWRNGETLDVVTGRKCTTLVGPQIGADVQNATVTTHVWYYELETSNH